MSVLLGDKSVALGAWTAHVDRRRAVVPCRNENAPGLARAYVTDRDVRADLRRAIERRAARALQLAPRELGARLHGQTAFDRHMFLETLRRALARTGNVISAGILDLALAPSASAVDLSSNSPLDLLVGAVATLGPDAPAVVLDADDLHVASACNAAVYVAEMAPSLDLALLLPESQWLRWAQVADGHPLAVLREGVVNVATGGEAEVTPSRPRFPSPPAAPAPPRTAPDDEARSAAERALFDALEQGSDTRGLFALNHMLPVLFGGAALEIDLFCRQLHIAVEVDGFHHFQTPEAYRRDRRKDLLLQENGILVVRVLAEDVMSRLDDVVGAVRMAVDRRKKRGTVVS